MRPYFFIFFLALTVISCSSVKKTEPIRFNIKSLPCDIINQHALAKLIGKSVVDLIFQTVSNTATLKNCIGYANSKPEPIPVINMIAVPVKDSTSTQEALFTDLLKNGIQGKDVDSKFKKFPDNRFKAVSSDSNPIYNQIYLEVDKQALVTIEYDKSLVLDKNVIDFERKLIEMFLYVGPQF
jgi:hypothetical protein